MKIFTSISIIFVFYAIIRVPLHQLAGAIDSAGRLYSILLILLIVIVVSHPRLRSMLYRKPIMFWIFWVFYALINTLTQGLNFDMKVWQFFTFLSAPLMTLLLISVNYKQLHKFVTLSAYLSLLIVIMFEGSVYFEGEGFRLGEIINSNEIGLDAALTLMFLFIFQRTNKMSNTLLLILSVLPIYLVIVTGSRGALISLFIIVSLSFLKFRTKNIFKTAAVLVVTIAIAYISLIYLEKYSIGFNRLMTTKAEGEMVVKTGTVLDNLGGRGIYYVIGWEIFNENPIFGVGLGNYKYHNTFSAQPNHVEIMIQLSELGIIGFLLFILFNFWIAKSLLTIWITNRDRKELRIEAETYLVAFLTIFAMAFTTYTYRSIFVFATYGLILGYIFEQNKYNLKRADLNRHLIA